ncbi:MAG: hypothetical protein QOH08_926 [Chloroflexota bacterium]|nr:hypothetical protein [Chloroflexota bacterium]
MDDRDKDLTGLFVRDLDEIALPPRGAWRRVTRRETTAMRTSRYLVTAGAVVAVLAVAIIVGVQLRDRGLTAANPSAPPPPAGSGSVVGPSASPTASPRSTGTATASPAPAGAVYNDDFGFVFLGPDGATIRKESSGGAIVPAFKQQSLTVSPDGRLVAYWRPGAGQNGEGAQLRMFNAAGNSTEQTLVSLASDQRGGGIVWSSDGTGILYSTETGAFGIGAGSGTNAATLNVYELAANGRHGTAIDTQTNTGWLYRPVAWDRSANTAAAGLTGEGGYMAFYVTVRINADSTFTAQRADSSGAAIGMGSVRASSDAKLVLGTATSGTVGYWPLADFAARKTASGSGQRGAQWQPGSHRIGFMSASGESFVLFSADDGSATTPFNGVKAGANLSAFRADGTAVTLWFISGPTTPTSLTNYAIYRLSDGATATFQELGQLIASVRLR